MRGFIGPHPRIDSLAATPRPDCITLRPFCTMVDWLSVMMMGPWHTIETPVDHWVAWTVENVRPGLAWYRAGIETKDFTRVFYVSDSLGEKLVTIQCAPRDHRKFPVDFMVVQFANSTLATGEWRELLANMQQMGCEHMGVQRVDIAADGWEDEGIGGGGDFIPVVQAALCGFGEYFGKAHWGTHHLGRGAKSFNGFQFGSRAGNKYMRCYRKKKEMKAKGLKPHIVAAWREALNGADPMKDPREVGRLEVQMKGKELRRYFAGESDARLLADLHDPLKRVEVFAATTRTMFDFRLFPKWADGRSRSARPMHAWDWSLCTTNAPAELSRERRANKVSPHHTKVALAALYEQYWLRSDPLVLECVDRLASASGLVDWYRQKEPVWQARCAALAKSDDEFTAQYLRRLAMSAQEEPVDHTAAFQDAAELHADVDDDDDLADLL